MPWEYGSTSLAYNHGRLFTSKKPFESAICNCERNRNMSPETAILFMRLLNTGELQAATKAAASDRLDNE